MFGSQSRPGMRGGPYGSLSGSSLGTYGADPEPTTMTAPAPEAPPVQVVSNGPSKLVLIGAAVAAYYLFFRKK